QALDVNHVQEQYRLDRILGQVAGGGNRQIRKNVVFISVKIIQVTRNEIRYYDYMYIRDDIKMDLIR
ncbi:MAG TPA: hypothetical protein VF419_02625, partial [Nitrososphaeraceae archaeon]